MANLKKLLKHAQEHLEPGETVDAVALGAYETKIMGNDSVRNGILMATNRRVLFYAKKVGGYDLESFPYENISSFEQSKGMMGGKVSFYSSGNKVNMKWIKEGDLGELTRLVRERMGKGDSAAPTAPPPPAPAGDDIPAQIKQLAALRDDGILTEDEFAAKKADLLSKM